MVFRIHQPGKKKKKNKRKKNIEMALLVEETKLFTKQQYN